MSDPKDASYLDSYDPARLSARDAEDLAVISALLQDAVIVSAEAAYLPKQRRFAFVANRYRWEAPDAEERVRVGVHFDNVLRAQAKGVTLSGEAQPISLLSISFEAVDDADAATPEAGGETPGPTGGIVRLHCAGKAEIRLWVDAIEAQLRDMTQPWPAKRRPEHRLGE